MKSQNVGRQSFAGLGAGAEPSAGKGPDECYVIGAGPPETGIPDLALEVVWTAGGIGKLAIYRQLGVPEVWYWQQGRLLIFVLSADAYQQRPRSTLLPGFDPDTLTRFMQGESQTQAVRAYRRLLRQDPAT